MAGLFRNNPSTPEGKYLVKRRDGSIPEWPYFVLGARDPAAAEALRLYADLAYNCGMDRQYINDVRDLAEQFESYLKEFGAGDPDAPPHRKDDPETVAEMTQAQSA